ncbi:lmo0937 family membrane protein [Paracandidimonas soli]|uniref:Lmo0937 family membrane protein n=1 Tax=Paracandidimonas soli TaxID=1917182 RepID=A0A4R3V8Z3_9BURK|nr:lmo0937 family membrane protein [Paracandidimonas soli]TCU98914.1 hypothetical protein EV686_1048 [Paracandidimonas soli]
MLYTVAVAIFVLWLLGLATSTTLGGYIHILLLIALAVVVISFLKGRHPL